MHPVARRAGCLGRPAALPEPAGRLADIPMEDRIPLPVYRRLRALTALAVGGYALVCVWYRPLAHCHGLPGNGFDPHLAGYVLSAALIAGFVLPAARGWCCSPATPALPPPWKPRGAARRGRLPAPGR